MAIRTASGIAVLALFVSALGACSSGAADGVHVAASDYGDAWPLTVEEGTLSCDRTAVVFSADDKAYRLNGGRGSQDYAWGGDIQAEDKAAWRQMGKPDDFVPKKDMQPLIDRGLELCS